MSVNKSFNTEEYYALLEKCAVLADKSRRLDAICNAYDGAKKKLNKLLEEHNSICENAERLLDVETGEIKAEAKQILAGIEGAEDILTEMSRRYAEKLDFAAKNGSNDALMTNIHAVLAICDYEKAEKAMKEELGRDAAEAIMYEQKKRVLEFEKTLGTHFFLDQVEKLEALFAARVLFAKEGEFSVAEQDCLCEENVVLTNGKGERLHFEKNAQLTYRRRTYVELVIKEDLRMRQLNYYRLEKAPGGYKLTLEEDEKVFDALWKKYDKLTIGK